MQEQLKQLSRAVVSKEMDQRLNLRVVTARYLEATITLGVTPETPILQEIILVMSREIPLPVKFVTPALIPTQLHLRHLPTKHQGATIHTSPEVMM
jgi:hypothetical protein